MIYVVVAFGGKNENAFEFILGASDSKDKCNTYIDKRMTNSQHKLDDYFDEIEGYSIREIEYIK